MPGACASPLDKFAAMQMCFASGSAEKKSYLRYSMTRKSEFLCRRNAALSRHGKKGNGYHRPAAIIDLTLLTWSGEDHSPRLWYLGSAQRVNEASNALIATLESVVGNQILPDCPGIAIPTKAQLDDFPVGCTRTRRAYAFRVAWLLPLNPTPKSVITAMAGFEIALAFPFVERFSGLGLGLKLG